MMRATFAQSMLELVVRLYRLAAETGYLMVGLSDYPKYVEHRRCHHPGEPVMSREEFFRNCEDRRYAPHGGGGIRCC
jgi:uncharacterized short protein YbdD (DUF466 family)